MTDPDLKSCSIQKQNSGMINTPLSGGCADEKVTIHRRADCLCPEAGGVRDVRARRLPQAGYLRCHFLHVA
ncbi:TPA: hypothetical protein G9B13_000960 [Salmonella enterica]|uniref:Uncharacterized protein n=1 Tax=Salmonella enterica TaxID=28901 RepID=A0A742WWZ1_SALER|nr:hypothetical protein [Salmonella enterica]HBZ2244475.1 hypothetical protein [Klebsiella pneumoniae]HAF1985350.1 hypothetical protein [Salmonella enterica]HAF4408249.1 hypothetical protein [Salmonella enterica]HAF5917425.1 hypothetical protein [Salmonella enterica]